jgi:hypothetical protein
VVARFIMAHLSVESIVPVPRIKEKTRKTLCLSLPIPAHGQKTLTESGTLPADRRMSSTPERRKKTITGTARTAGRCLTYHGKPWYSV